MLGRGLSIEAIARRFGKHPSTVSYWMKKYGLAAPGRKKHQAKGGIERDVLAGLVERGMTIAEISTEVGLSKATVRHWLRRYGLRTRNARGRRPQEVAQAAKEAGLRALASTCPRHGESEFVLEGRGYYRCKRCRSEAVARRRRKVKTILVAEAGGRCVRCGYDRNPAALQFHHLDPETKRIALSARGIAYALDTVREEAQKCVLLCATCHAEVESGDPVEPMDSAPIS
jgi:transposase